MSSIRLSKMKSAGHDAKENTRKVSVFFVPESVVVKDNEKVVLGNVMEKHLPMKIE